MLKLNCNIGKMEKFNLIVFGFVAFWAAVGCVGLYLLFRNLSLRQAGMRDEIENLAAVQRRALERLHNLSHKVQILSESIPGNERQEQGNAEPPEPTVDLQSVKEDVLFLAEQGLDVKTIAKDLGLPSGEVELILDLERFGRKG